MICITCGKEFEHKKQKSIYHCETCSRHGATLYPKTLNEVQIAFKNIQSAIILLELEASRNVITKSDVLKAIREAIDNDLSW